MNPIFILSPGRSGSEYVRFLLAEITHFDFVERKDNSYKETEFLDNHIYKRHYEFSSMLSYKANFIISMRDPRDIAVSAAFYNNSDPTEYLSNDWSMSWVRDYVRHLDHDNFLYKIEDNSVSLLKDCLNFLNFEYDDNKIEKIFDRYSWDFYHETNSRHYRSGKCGQWKDYIGDWYPGYIQRNRDVLTSLGYDTEL